MGYSPLTTYNTGQPVVAYDLGSNSGLEEVLSDLRDYVNRGITASDFSSNSIRTEDLLEGEPIGSTRSDFLALTGDVFSQSGDSARVNRMYLTGTFAVTPDYTASYERYQQAPGMSKKIRVERQALVIVTVWVMVVAGESNLSFNVVSPEGQIYLSSTNFNSVNNVVPYGDGLFFVEDAGLAAPNSGPQPAGSAMNRRPYSFTFMEQVPGGEVTYTLLVDLHSEKMFVSARNMTIEVLYL